MFVILRYLLQCVRVCRYLQRRLSREGTCAKDVCLSIYVYEKNERQFLYLLLRILCIEYFCRFEHVRLSVYRCVRAEVYLIQIQVSFVRYSILMSVFRYAMCKCMSVSMFEHVFVVFSICMYVCIVCRFVVKDFLILQYNLRITLRNQQQQFYVLRIQIHT